ncbi:PDDEXK family nuclease [Bifidobacterium leontopitheci]|uniref:hypothetical protein n=1 Tax=Bifidobacterium leontopitheci TaxID=2650774 RepID=UPI001264498F|nr:hypothetical protein [Bifidobacterium leontopitheci]
MLTPEFAVLRPLPPPDTWDDYAFSRLQAALRRTMLRCERALSDSYGTTRGLVFSHITALALHGIELPRGHGLEEDVLHAVVRRQSARYRRGDIRFHLWARDCDSVSFAGSPVECVPPVVAWMQLAEQLPLVELIVLANTMLHGDPRLRVCERDDFDRYLAGAGRFRGRAKCVQALPFITPDARSSWESRTSLALLQHGLPQAVLNYVITDDEAKVDWIADLAYPEYKVVIEYQGDHHRMSKRQYRSDQRKCRRLQALGWVVITVTVDDLRDEESRAELAASVAKAMGVPLPQSLDRRCLALLDGWA